MTTVEYLDHLSSNLVVETVVARGMMFADKIVGACPAPPGNKSHWPDIESGMKFAG
jgi:hypothetical protein